MKSSHKRELKPQRKRLRLEQIKTEPETFQFRELEVTEDHVRNLSDAIRAGNELDPLTIWERGPDDFVVLDGHHRYAAYKACGYTKAIPAVVHQCNEAKAAVLALQENTKTKLPMTKTERTNAAWRLVCSDYGLSKAETVKATGVGDGTVANMRRHRKQLEAADEVLPDTWLAAIQAVKGLHDDREWDEDMQEEVINARAKQLDDQIGEALGRMGSIQWEAVARVLEWRLSKENLGYILDDLSGADSDEDEDDFPF